MASRSGGPDFTGQDPTVQEKVITEDLLTEWTRKVMKTGGQSTSKSVTIPRAVCKVESTDAGENLPMAYDSDRGVLIIDVRGETLGGDDDGHR